MLIGFKLVGPPMLGGPVNYIIVSGNSMEPTLHPGDLVLVRTSSSYRVGDVVAFRIPEGQAGAGALVIHRIVGRSAREGFVLQGDNKSSPDLWRPRPEDVVGRRWLRVPRLGLWLTVLRHPLVLATAAAMFGFIAVVFWEGSSTASGSGPQVRERRRRGVARRAA
jgi:signal peptidase I